MLGFLNVISLLAAISGSLWAAVLGKGDDPRFLADLYLEGCKMRKSLGNVVDPHAIIEGGRNSKEAPGYGADVMRLWVSSVNYIDTVLCINSQQGSGTGLCTVVVKVIQRFAFIDPSNFYIDVAKDRLYVSHLYGKVQVEMLKHVEDEIIETIPYTGEYLVQGSDRVWIGVLRARGMKCERCWNYTPQVSSSAEHPTLCGRCYKVVVAQPEPTETTD
ncbi:hypothetical protein D5086_017379 [Populus alba]|uniref:Uncharacterized protein n=1 Tax=Populus alba TaxID=43335 RepID=A0ACC4BX94_POPAL